MVNSRLLQKKNKKDIKCQYQEKNSHWHYRFQATLKRQETCNEHFHDRFDNLNKFLENHKLPKLTQKQEIYMFDETQRPMLINGVKVCVKRKTKNFSTRKPQVRMTSLANSIKHLKKK